MEVEIKTNDSHKKPVYANNSDYVRKYEFYRVEELDTDSAQNRHRKQLEILEAAVSVGDILLAIGASKKEPATPAVFWLNLREGNTFEFIDTGLYQFFKVLMLDTITEIRLKFPK